MASIFTSANNAGASVFDTVDIAASAATQAVRTVSRAISMLDTKAETMHKNIIVSAVLEQNVGRDNALITIANQHVDALEESHRKNRHGVVFDRAATFDLILKRLEDALTQAKL